MVDCGVVFLDHDGPVVEIVFITHPLTWPSQHKEANSVKSVSIESYQSVVVHRLTLGCVNFVVIR